MREHARVAAASASQLRVMRRSSRSAASASGDGIRSLDPQRIALALFIIMSISNLHMHFPVVAKVRPGLLLWIFLVSYPILVPRSIRWGNLTRSWPPKALIAFGVLACLSIPFGLSIGQSATFMLDVYARILLFGLVAVASIRNVQDLRILVSAYVISTVVLIFLSLFVLDVDAVVGGIERIQSQNSMYDSNDLGVLFLIGFALALLLLQASRTWWTRAFSLGVVLGVPAAVAVTGSRGAFVGFVAVGVALFLLVRHIPLVKRLGIVLGAMVVLSFAAPSGYWSQMGTILEPEDDYNVSDASGRIPILKRGIGYIAQYPVLGVGLNNFTRAEWSLSPIARTARPGDRMPVMAPHNTYLQVAAEMGIPALILWVALIGAGIFGLTRQRRRVPEGWKNGIPDERFLYYAHVYLPVAFVGFAVPSVFVSHAYLPSFYLLVAFLAGVLLLTSERLGSAIPAGHRQYNGARRSAGH
jgi:O-antigen ligase